MSTPSKKAIRQRSLALLVLLAAALLVAWPNALHQTLNGLSGVLGIKSLGNYNPPFVLGLDLQGGTHLEYQADVSKVPAADQGGAIDGVRDVIERRVNTLGVSEPLVQTTKAGTDWRVTVELAGIKDVNQAIKLIGETPILEFKEQNTEKARPLTSEEQKTLQEKNTQETVKADGIVKEAMKPGADFAALVDKYTENVALKANHGETGSFLQTQTADLSNGQTQSYTDYNSDYKDLVESVRGAATGTVIGHVIDRGSYYSVVKVLRMDTAGTEVQARHILIPFAGAQQTTTTTTRDQAKAQIEAIQKQLTVANFADMAKKYTQEPGGAARGGDLGWFKKGDLADEFEKNVFDLPKGTISQIFETPFGFHIALKEDERPLINPAVQLIDIKKTQETDIVPKPEPFKSTGLTGKNLQSARVDFDQRNGNVQVALQFDSEGTKLFDELTKRNIGKPVAIYLDGQPISVPTVNSEIPGGQAQISGNFTLDEAKTLARRLQAGALPVPITLIAQQTVGPSLGANSLDASLKAGLAGFLLVALFMVLLYRLPGLTAIAALVLYAALSATLFKLIPVTLTLSGIAGFVLTLGIAVDANVLVYERLKEELASGKAIPLALEEAFRRAWLSIRDGHMTVLISAAVLYWFSSSVIRGFALTLAIGTLLSLFTAIVVTRTILRLLANTGLSKYGWLFLKKR